MSYCKWQRVGLDPFVTALTNAAFRRFCDSSFEVWRHKVKDDCYRVTMNSSVENVMLDEVTFKEVIEFLEDDEMEE